MSVISSVSSSLGLNFVGCCLRARGYESKKDTSEHVVGNGIVTPEVMLDTSHMGNECVIVKNGSRICGTGGALANAPLLQDKSYFEIKIQSSGTWGLGVATTACNLSSLPLGSDDCSWVFRCDGSVNHKNVTIDKVNVQPEESAIIGCSFDHVEINFFLNGKNLHCPIRNIRGTVYPVVYVDDGCIIDVSFDNFAFPPPPGFQKVMFEKSLL